MHPRRSTTAGEAVVSSPWPAREAGASRGDLEIAQGGGSKAINTVRIRGVNQKFHLWRFSPCLMLSPHPGDTGSRGSTYGTEIRYWAKVRSSPDVWGCLGA